MTKEDFIRRWKSHVAGCIALGSDKARRVNSGTFEAVAAYGAVLVELNDTTERLLSQLYDSLQPPKPPEKK